MGLLSRVLLAPLRGPADGVFWVAARVAEQVDQERNSPAAIRRALVLAEEKLIAGDLSEEDYDEIETDLLLRLGAVGAGR